MKIKKPNRDPDYIWYSDNVYYQQEEFWFYEMIVYNYYTKECARIAVQNNYLITPYGEFEYKEAIQEAYQEFLEKEEEIEKMLIRGIYE